MGGQIRSFADIQSQLNPDDPVVTLFSGGLDSSYLLLRLAKAGFSDVHALSVNLGDAESTASKQSLASALGATLHVADRRHRFASDFVAPAIRAHAMYLGLHPVSSTLSRPLIAQCATELAGRLGAGAILHTANRSQNTLRRLNGALDLLGFPAPFGSPYDLEPISRETKLDALERHGVKFGEDRSLSGDSNLWCREFESGLLDNPEDHVIPESLFAWSVPSARAVTEELSVRFEAGLPVAVDDVDRDLLDVIEQLNVRVGSHGLGRFTGLEHLDHGEKVFEVREMPAAWLLFRTIRQLESACLPAPLLREKHAIEELWTIEGLEGRWFGPARAAAEAFIESCSRQVTGTVRWHLRGAAVTTTSIKVERPLYLTDREEWEQRSVARELSRACSHASLVTMEP